MKISFMCLTLFATVDAFVPAVSPSPTSVISSSCLFSTGIFYSTVGGDTGRCANLIGNAAGLTPMEVENVSVADVMKHDSLIVGSPTWNTGADTERSMTAWDQWLYEELPKLDLKGKKLAIFGVGDQMGYSFNYCDAVGELYDTFSARGITASYGRTPTEGYAAVESKAKVEDEDKWYGCLFDEVSQDDMSEDRANNWVAQLKDEGFFSE
mmetsp:Transcript_35754/g.64401  ORF Transcript_35754/g.64401 Transcript_35754/m.64401 type:complete len:210 (+) Transcript_35754:118-747(+)|eukprot:CAMPEP_0201918774 /NCGR_PEP_ID=MMETSP0903-20130614/7838_1 /ASSEMBLY_ACC=CAM_ASM_000552 /TAXON_ID=420261 /ORGANISM="Thalassiosira antarctica, Strain CCMP982" /LENGTH=209 /DNA_ID=CAMNT_0048455149 /DNA_START=97 /DNA_END=726 /DNA_ORIENTATION=+